MRRTAFPAFSVSRTLRAAVAAVLLALASGSTGRAAVDATKYHTYAELTRELADVLGLTVFLITHDLDTLHEICDRIAVLADKHVIAVGTITELMALDHPWIQEYFNGPRGRAALASRKD